MRGRPVAVTGIGVIAPCGTGPEAFWAGLRRPPEPQIVRRVPDWDPSPWIDRRSARHLDRFAQFALVAALLATGDAGLEPGEVDPELAGVSLGTGIGGVGALEASVLVRQARGPDRVSPYTVPMCMPNAGAAAVSLRLGWQGPSETLTTACAAGTHALGAGARLIADGRCEVVLAGGAESSLTPTTVAAFTTMTALTRTGISRPFDPDRDGFAASEGAALLVLEPLERARARGARVYAVLAGAASTCDAYHLTAPAPGGRGAAACMRRALADAGIAAAEVVHVNAHGTSTVLNDQAEAEAISTVLGGRRVPVTSVKGVLGHALGAAGALEAAAVALSFAHAELPPTLGTSRIDPRVDLDVVLEPRPFTPGPVLSNSFGFGGHNGTVVFVPDPDPAPAH